MRVFFQESNRRSYYLSDRLGLRQLLEFTFFLIASEELSLRETRKFSRQGCGGDFSSTDDWMHSIDSVKNIEEEKHFSSQEHRCGASRKLSCVRINILI